MMSSRGMGAINPKKISRAKTIVRKDNPNEVAAYKKGGLAKQAATAIAMKAAGQKPKKMAEGDLVDDTSVKPNYAVFNPDFKAAGARFSANKKLDKDSDIEAYMDVNAMKAKDRDFQAKPGKVGLVYNKRFAEGGKSTVNSAGNYTKPELRKRIFNAVKAEATAGTGAGEWSARKSQVLAKRYKAAGGGYRD